MSVSPEKVATPPVAVTVSVPPSVAPPGLLNSATVKVSSPFTVKASIEDAYGNVVTTASSSVSVALANNPTGATLGGTLTVAAGQGVASFTNLTINKVGSGYTLQVSSKGLTSATTNPFNLVSSATGGALAVTTTTGPPDPLLGPLVLDSPDLWDGLGFKKRSRSV